MQNITLNDNEKWNFLDTTEIIDLKETLFSGQIFNFHKTDLEEFTGTIYFFVISFKQVNQKVLYKILHTKINSEELILFFIKKFFNLNLSYKDILKDIDVTGLRLITNSLIPTIFSFICSANNNVKRITKMVNYMYSKGEFACSYKKIDFFYFPDISRLLDCEHDFKENGFGYRARYICKTADLLKNDKLFAEINKYDVDILQFKKVKNNLNINLIKNLLIKLPGIGFKVRDCICLMSLECFEIVPIDTHILKYARHIFNLENNVLLTKISYNKIQSKFIEKFGKYAGIYQLFIFKKYLEKKIIN